MTTILGVSKIRGIYLKMDCLQTDLTVCKCVQIIVEHHLKIDDLGHPYFWKPPFRRGTRVPSMVFSSKVDTNQSEQISILLYFTGTVVDGFTQISSKSWENQPRRSQNQIQKLDLSDVSRRQFLLHFQKLEGQVMSSCCKTYPLICCPSNLLGNPNVKGVVDGSNKQLVPTCCIEPPQLTMDSFS